MIKTEKAGLVFEYLVFKKFVDLLILLEEDEILLEKYAYDLSKLNKLDLLEKLSFKTYDFLKKKFPFKIKNHEFFLKKKKEEDLKFFSEKKEYLLSLKLLEKNHWIVSKNAGIKSFFSTYFQEKDLDFDGYVQEKFFLLKSSKPGDLTQKDYLKIYLNIRNEFYDYFLKLNNLEEGLYKLMGFSHSNSYSLYTFYEKDYLFHSLLFLNKKDLKIKIKSIKREGHSSIVFDLDNYFLRIRIKPMMFLDQSYKVNCSFLPKSFI